MSSFNYFEFYFVFGVAHLNDVLVGNRVSVVHQTVDSVGNSAHSDGDAESQNVDSGWTDQMVWHLHQFISSICDQVSLETQTEWHVQGDIGASSQTCQLHKSNPFQYSSVFVNDFTLFKV